MANETLLLIDGSHMANRAWHTRELHTSDGLDTSVLHGVLEGIQIECERFATGRFLVVWDAPGRTFRHDIFNEYKVRQYETTPEKVEDRRRRKAATALCEEALEALKIPQVKIPGLECDDIVGLMAANANRFILTESNPLIHRAVIVSDDKDFYQCVRGEHVVVYRPIKEQLVDERWLDQHYGIRPQQWVDLKAMVGEPSTGDNIPGIDGLGEKTALAYLAAHRDLAGIQAMLQDRVASGAAGKREKSFLAQWGKTQMAWRLSKVIESWDELKCFVAKDELNGIQTTMKRVMCQALDCERDLDLVDVVRWRERYEFGSLVAEKFANTCGYRLHEPV